MLYVPKFELFEVSHGPPKAYDPSRKKKDDDDTAAGGCEVNWRAAG
jgi:hypothetical protein